MSESEVPPTDPAAIAPSNPEEAQAVADTTETTIPPNDEISSSAGDAQAETELKDTQMMDVSSDQPPSARLAAQTTASNAPSPSAIPPRVGATMNGVGEPDKGERTSSRAASVNPDAGPSPATMPAEAAPHGAPVRQYINSKITSVLLEGMKIVAKEQPKDPLRVLGEFLLQKSKELEGTGAATS